MFCLPGHCLCFLQTPTKAPSCLRLGDYLTEGFIPLLVDNHVRTQSVLASIVLTIWDIHVSAKYGANQSVLLEGMLQSAVCGHSTRNYQYHISTSHELIFEMKSGNKVTVEAGMCMCVAIGARIYTCML